MNNLISFKVSKRLNKNISNCGKILIKGLFNVSNKIINAMKEITNTNKYEKKFIRLFFLTLLSTLIFFLTSLISLFVFILFVSNTFSSTKFSLSLII